MQDQDRKYRQFFVNNKLEFSYFLDESLTTKKEILDKFFEDNGWKFMAKYCNWKVKYTRASEDLTKIYITVKETSKDDKTEEDNSEPTDP